MVARHLQSQQMRDRQTVVEIACLTLLLGDLVWVPLPFGSASDAAFTPLVLPPLLLCAMAAGVVSRRDGIHTRHGHLWTIGAISSISFIVLQLVPFPLPMLRLLSPESASMWRAA